MEQHDGVPAAKIHRAEPKTLPNGSDFDYLWPAMEAPPKQGMGCFAKGCLTLVIIVFVLVGAVAGGAWFLYGKAINIFTSTQPADIQIEEPSDAQFQTAEGKLTHLRQAVSNNQETTVDFTATDINALIARDPGFAGVRGRTRVSIADSTVTLQLSTPLDKVPLPRLKNRWFNGTASFQFSYDLGKFVVAAKSAEATGHAFPEAFFASFNSSFNRSFNDSFQQKLKENQQEATFWKHIKTMGVDGDKLVIKTQQD